jgi:hypothetical protein
MRLAAINNQGGPSIVFVSGSIQPGQRLRPFAHGTGFAPGDVRLEEANALFPQQSACSLAVLSLLVMLTVPTKILETYSTTDLSSRDRIKVVDRGCTWKLTYESS